MVFNLIPIPPLDGSKLLAGILHSPRYANFLRFLETRGPILLIGILLIDNFTQINIFGGLFQTVIDFVYRLVF
jgi:Zn-dependent protease